MYGSVADPDLQIRNRGGGGGQGGVLKKIFFRPSVLSLV